MMSRVSNVLFLFMFLLSGREDRDSVLGIENPAFDGGGSISLPLVWLRKEIRGDRPDSTLTAHPKKMEVQAPAKERGEPSFFISLKYVGSRYVPDLTFTPAFLRSSSHNPALVPAFQSKHVLTSKPS